MAIHSFSYGLGDSAIPQRNRPIVMDFRRRGLAVELKTILRRLIRDKGLTITGLSRKTKVPVQTIHGWLQGVEPKGVRQLKAVADFLEVDLDYLCFGIKPKTDLPKIENFENDINAGVFEVVLRRVKK